MPLCLTALLPCPADSFNCLFVPGIGWHTAAPTVTTSGSAAIPTSLASYWGDIAALTPECSKRVFLQRDMANTAWSDAELAQALCDAAGASTAGQEVANTVVYSLDVGNLAVAGAVATGQCSLATSSQWIQLQVRV